MGKLGFIFVGAGARARPRRGLHEPSRGMRTTGGPRRDRGRKPGRAGRLPREALGLARLGLVSMQAAAAGADLRKVQVALGLQILLEGLLSVPKSRTTRRIVGMSSPGRRR